MFVYRLHLAAGITEVIFRRAKAVRLLWQAQGCWHSVLRRRYAGYLKFFQCGALTVYDVHQVFLQLVHLHHIGRVGRIQFGLAHKECQRNIACRIPAFASGRFFVFIGV